MDEKKRPPNDKGQKTASKNNSAEAGQKKVFTFSNTKPDVLVIHCSDGRFQKAFNEFLENIGVVDFDRLAIPGGGQFFFAPSHLPKAEWAGRRWTEFLTKAHGIKKIIVIAHEDCGWYKEITVGPFSISLLKDRQMNDLKKTGKIIADFLPGMSVEVYFAHLEDDAVSFEKI